MEFASKYADAFAELFRGNPSHHGVHIPAKVTKKGEKAEGKSFTREGKITIDHIVKHLHGKESIGVSPLNEFGNIRFAVIDVDVYPLDPVKYLHILGSLSLPFIGFRSKSGGLHLYVFFAQDTDAGAALPLLQRVRQLLGLPKDTEIFPKQTKLIGKGAGNWINLPYFDYKKTERYAYSPDGTALKLGELLPFANKARVTLNTLERRLKDAPLSKAPPCLQTLFAAGGPEEGGRNLFLFNAAIYLKARFGKNYAENLHAFNEALKHPIPAEELDRTIIHSHNKGDYSYQCEEGLLSIFCNKEDCIERQYGKGAGAVSDLSFGQLIQVKCAEPYYKWYVNNAEMLFFNENELLSQTKFRELCLRLLHKVPNNLKPNAWNEILNRALANIVIEEAEATDDLSEDSLWLSKVTEFFSRRKALRPSQVEDGLVWLSEDNELMFKGARLVEFLDKTNLFRHYKKTQHRNLLKTMGAKTVKLRYADKGVSQRVWAIDLNEMHNKGLMVNIRGMKDKDEEIEEKSFTPLDFLGDEKF